MILNTFSYSLSYAHKNERRKPEDSLLLCTSSLLDLHPVDEWDEEYGEDEDDDVHGQTHFDEVGKFVSSHTLNDKVRLITNRRRESRTCSKADADDERHRSESHVLGN